ncbi:MAG: hypothetical protein NTV80_23915 [Verrucomicrobia bacterium]|nr:hypothetical protein [Verrucomicrobiota bacterium]
MLSLGAIFPGILLYGWIERDWRIISWNDLPLIGLLLFIALFCGYKVIQIVVLEYRPKVLNPAEIRMNQLLAVCDSVDGLPKAFKSFNQFCDHISDLQTRRLLHQLHQIRPGLDAGR